MTVQELIDSLSEIEDRALEVVATWQPGGEYDDDGGVVIEVTTVVTEGERLVGLVLS